MGTRLFLADDFEHPQENRAFRHLCSAGSQYLAGDTVIIGNIPYGGDGQTARAGQIDALVIRRTSITVVDFKDYGGAVRISEDTEWTTVEGARIAGGVRDVNPFAQVARYKSALAGWLSRSGLLRPPNDLGHISGLVMFTQPMAVDDAAMSWKARKWFLAADQQGGVEFLRDRASPRLDLSLASMDAIVGAMGVKPFELKLGDAWVPSSAVRAARQAGYFEAMQEIEDAEQSRWWAENGERIQAEYEEACRGWAIMDGILDKPQDP
ncbi:nuclease-related domain-containing protein [Roseomonas sp. BN140053]|uniref:nuclease-related domain-containing protein n=1 Tax=Roseomonas sp. BN140053 TaxID=3391898 RepID=UPI0039EA0FAF